MSDVLRDSILKLGQSAPVPLTAPGWPEGVYLRKIEAGEHEELDRAGAAAKQTYGVPYPDNFQGMLLVRTLCDASGNRLFTNGDAAQIAKLPQHVVGPAFEQAAAMNGLAATAAEDAAKNSESDPDSGSSSTLPDTSGGQSKS